MKKAQSASKHLFADKSLEKGLEASDVAKFFDRYFDGKAKRPMYFYDGNNGDKHMLVGWTKDYTKDGSPIEYLLGVNLTQCHLASRGPYDNCFKTADAVANEMDIIENGMHLMTVLNKVNVYSF